MRLRWLGFPGTPKRGMLKDPSHWMARFIRFKRTSVWASAGFNGRSKGRRNSRGITWARFWRMPRPRIICGKRIRSDPPYGRWPTKSFTFFVKLGCHSKICVPIFRSMDVFYKDSYGGRAGSRWWEAALEQLRPFYGDWALQAALGVSLPQPIRRGDSGAAAACAAHPMRATSSRLS